MASSAFGRWETPTFLAFPGLPRPRSLTRFNIMPGTIFWYFWQGIIWPQLAVYSKLVFQQKEIALRKIDKFIRLYHATILMDQAEMI